MKTWLITLPDGKTPADLCPERRRDGGCYVCAGIDSPCYYEAARPARRTTLLAYQGMTFSTEHDLFIVERKDKK